MLISNNIIKNNYKYILAGVAITLFLLFLFNYFNGVSRSANKVDMSTLGELNALAPTTTDTYKLYDEEAKYTVINYFSLDCIHCRKAFLLEDKMLDDLRGKVNIIYRHNPLASQPLSASKAAISLCVQDYDSHIYFDFIREVFNKYDLYNINNNWVKSIAYKYVNKIELEKCINEKRFEEIISKTKLENTINNIIYTPIIILFKNNPAPSGAGEYIKKYDGITESGVVNLYKWLIKN